MPRFCSNCASPHDDDAPWCDRCGSDLASADCALAAVLVPVRRHEVVVDRVRVNCVCHEEVLRFDPVAESMASVFRCMVSPERIDCVGCRVCPRCGDQRCSCGSLAISINVRLHGRTIETVPLRRDLV